MWSLSSTLQKMISKILTNRPYNFIIILPNEFRRGLALIAAVKTYRQFALNTPYHNEYIVPTFMGGLTLCVGGLLFPIYERNLLPNSINTAKQSVLDNITWRLLVPFLCAFYYNLCLMHSAHKILPFEPEFVVVTAFMAVPVGEWLTTTTSTNNVYK